MVSYADRAKPQRTSKPPSLSASVSSLPPPPTSEAFPAPSTSSTSFPASPPPMATPPVLAKPPVANVWTLRAARRAAPVPEPSRVTAPPPPPPRADDDPFVVRVRSANTNADPWPTVARANSNTHSNAIDKVSRPSSPPSQRPQSQSRTPSRSAQLAPQNTNTGHTKKLNSNSNSSNGSPNPHAAVSSSASTPPQTTQTESAPVSVSAPETFSPPSPPHPHPPPSPPIFTSGSTSIVKNVTNGHSSTTLTNPTTSRPKILAIGVSPRTRARRLADVGLEAAEVVDVESISATRTGEHRLEFGTTGEGESWGASGTGYTPGYTGGYGGMGFGAPGTGMDGMPPAQGQVQAAVYPGYAYPMYGYPYGVYDAQGALMYGHGGPMGEGMMQQGMVMPMGMMPPPPMLGMGAYGMQPPPQGQAQAQMQGVGQQSQPVNGASLDGEGVPSSSSSAGGGGSMNGNGNGGETSDWEVKDYGSRYGGYPAREEQRNNAFVPRPPPPPRELDQQQQAHAQDDRPPRDMDDPPGRPRRGSYNGGAYYEPRGAYGGRRGRGNFRGYGRFGRGGGGFQPQQQGRAPPLTQPQQQQPPPFAITPPPHFTPLAPEGYWAPAPYRPASLEYPPPQHHLAPVPTPRTRLSFPIDRLRQEILSQLEFYLSPDNMATDLYLRQQMDSQGWVRIEMLASFKRVQSKTSDVNLVRDVLGLSDYAEIRGEWVRSTEGWEKFVLPTAQPSIVDAETSYSLLLQADKAGHVHAPAEDGEEVDEEDEEDVVFVMGSEAQAWSPERPR
ncbi:hypothetical protein C8R46DRAFT_14796 [Mycena filopes]|nr:hypothetical protein C8R46DRAFT_14796 [Mycena filopes]